MINIYKFNKMKDKDITKILSGRNLDKVIIIGNGNEAVYGEIIQNSLKSIQNFALKLFKELPSKLYEEYIISQNIYAPLYGKILIDKKQSNWNDYCNINYNQKRFYPHYGTASLRKHTRLYKKGLTKGKNKKSSRIEKVSKLTNFLASDKKGRKTYAGKNWKKAF